MPSFTSLSALVGVLALVANPAGAGPVRQVGDFSFKNAGPNENTCPAADGTKYSAGGKTFGILCGWDTKSRGHKWGPYYHLNFHECIEKCAEKPGCSIATYTGTCYLKKSAKGKGLVRGNSPKNLAAIKLKQKGKGKDDDKEDDDEKKHGKGNKKNHKGEDDEEKKHHKGKKKHHQGSDDEKDQVKGKKKHHKSEDDDEKKHNKDKKKHHKAGDDDEKTHVKGKKKHHKGQDDDDKKHGKAKNKHDGGVKKHHKDDKKKHAEGPKKQHKGPIHGAPTTKTYSLTYAQHHPTRPAGIKIIPNHPAE